MVETQTLGCCFRLKKVKGAWQPSAAREPGVGPDQAAHGKRHYLDNGWNWKSVLARSAAITKYLPLAGCRTSGAGMAGVW